MVNVFIFFIKDHEKNEVYFFTKRCTKKKNVLKYGDMKSNYYFMFDQNNHFDNKDKHPIEYINASCFKVRECIVEEKQNNFEAEFIVAVHPPGRKDTDALIDWQVDMKRKTGDIEKFNAQIVYYSSKDMYNPFLKKHEKYNYNYDTLFKESEEDEGEEVEEAEVIEQEFEKFLNLLKARAKGEEIDFFDLKKKMDDLFNIFFEKALICKGLLECLKRERFDESITYYLKSFGKKDFKTILTELKESDEVKELKDNERYKKEIFKQVCKNLMAKLEELKPDSYEGLSGDNLKNNEKKLVDFLDWYVDFLKILLNSLKEVEKSEH